MRLIDADALESNGICFTVHGGAKFISLESVRTAPTIEAKPVKHGWWIVQDEGRTRFMCSVCKSKNHRGGENFCSNCGADMRGADNA